MTPSHNDKTPRRLILHSSQCPGDILIMTAAIRDLHRAHPGRFITDVRTSSPAVWEHNPFITRLHDRTPDVEHIKMHYPLIQTSNQRPYHFIHGYAQYLEEQLDVRIPVTDFHGEIYLSERERTESPHPRVDRSESYWIIIAGGKFDFTAKWWSPDAYQEVVDRLQGRVRFVQCGDRRHWHPPLRGVENLVGETSLRGFIRMMHRAEGVVCPVTFAMHLAAATPRTSSRPGARPAVVIAGGREPSHWEAYPHHRFLSTVGALSCCDQGGCWKSRCHKVGDGDPKDWRDACESPVHVGGGISIPRCMDMISPEDVVRAVLSYYEGGVVPSRTPNKDAGLVVPTKSDQATGPHNENTSRCKDHELIKSIAPAPSQQNDSQDVLIRFSHGLGDSIQFTAVLQHLRLYFPEWNIDVAAQPGCFDAMQGLCRKAFPLSESKGAEQNENYARVLTLRWAECRSEITDAPSTKASRCLEEVFKIRPLPELCRYSIRIPGKTKEAAQQYMESIGAAPLDHSQCDNSQCDQSLPRYRAVVIHYQGRTSRMKKDLPSAFVRHIVQRIQKRGRVPIILDWNDTPSLLINQKTVHCPRPGHPIWSEAKEGTASGVAALIEASEYMIGIDSGPLHVAGAVDTPTFGIWTRHHPIHYFDHADNVEHWVPRFHKRLAAGAAAVEYFRKNYRHHIYGDLEKEFLVALTKRLQE